MDRKQVIRIGVLVLAYVLLGNARSIQPNPFIPGANIAVNMFVPVLAGVLFGMRAGILVGVLGTFLTALTPAGSVFEWLAIIPHGIMGGIAGHLRGKLPSPIVACSLIVGHVLNLVMFISFNAMQTSMLTGALLYGLLYEMFMGVVALMLVAGIYRLAGGTD